MRKRESRIELRISGRAYQELVIRIPVKIIYDHLGEKSSEIGVSIYNLTNREREILSLMLTGKGNKEVANELNIALRTAKYHASRIYMKIGVQGRHELLKFYTGTDVERLGKKTHVNWNGMVQ